MTHHQRLSAREIITSTARSDEYLEARARLPKEIGARALAVAAGFMANRQVNQNKGYETAETLQRRLVAVIPDWHSSQVELDKRGKQMTRDERARHLEPVVEFNHIFRQMIDNEVYTTMSETLNDVSEVMLMLGYQHQAINYGKERTRAVLDGMRHEIASESIIARLPGVYDVRGGEGVEDERRGRDIYVEFDDDTEVSFDIKSTDRAAQEANLSTRPGSDYVAVWSGLTWEDFGDLLIPSNEVLDKKSGYLQSVIDGMRLAQQPIAK